MVIPEKIKLALRRFEFHSQVDFDKLPMRDKKELLAATSKVLLKPKEILFSQGSNAVGVFVLKKGKLKVYQLNYDGSIQILFIYREGEIFGYRPLLSGDRQPVSVAALENCELDFISRERFLKVLRKSAVLSNQILENMSHEFTVLTNRMNVFAQRSIRERLALALLILNETFKTELCGSKPSEILINRGDLAAFIGTVPETLTRTISYFKERKFIRVNGKSIWVKDFENLFILSGIE